jgi:hypothetical protein
LFSSIAVSISRAAANDIVADRGGEIGRIGRAAGPAQQCDALDVFDDFVVRPDGPRQLAREPSRARRMVHLSFTPWHALPEHKPLGSINRLRKVVYERISNTRHQLKQGGSHGTTVRDAAAAVFGSEASSATVGRR